MNIKKATLCAKLSNLAYDDINTQTIERFSELGFDHVKFFEHNSSQGYVVHNTIDIYIIFRGTELAEIRDMANNGMFWPTYGQKQGKVHSGFACATDEIWDGIQSYTNAEVAQYKMQDNVTFTGHSLGGAMAIIGAARSKFVADIYTFGSPRTGNRKYHNNIRSRMYRITNEHDIIPLILPPIGYYHGGVEYRMNNEVMHEVTSYLDSWRWQIKIGFQKMKRFEWLRSMFTDHAISKYITHLTVIKLEIKLSK